MDGARAGFEEDELPRIDPRSSWALVLRGALAMTFGAITVARPGLSLWVLVLLFGGFALAEGVVSIAGALHGGGPRNRRAVLLLRRALGVAIGLVTMLVPGITALVLVYWIGAWAIAVGLAEIVVALRIRTRMPRSWMLGSAGLASVLVGIVLLIAPAVSALSLVVWFGIFCMLFGAVLAAIGFRLLSAIAQPIVASTPK